MKLKVHIVLQVAAVIELEHSCESEETQVNLSEPDVHYDAHVIDDSWADGLPKEIKEAHQREFMHVGSHAILQAAHSQVGRTLQKRQTQAVETLIAGAKGGAQA